MSGKEPRPGWEGLDSWVWRMEGHSTGIPRVPGVFDGHDQPGPGLAVRSSLMLPCCPVLQVWPRLGMRPGPEDPIPSCPDQEFRISRPTSLKATAARQLLGLPILPLLRLGAGGTWYGPAPCFRVGAFSFHCVCLPPRVPI